MPLTRKYKTKNGTIKKRTYSMINGTRVESYRREQNRRYKAQKHALHPPRKRTYPVSQADTLAADTMTLIIDGHRNGESVLKLSTTTGLSRYIVKKVIDKYSNNVHDT